MRSNGTGGCHERSETPKRRSPAGVGSAATRNVVVSYDVPCLSGIIDCAEPTRARVPLLDVSSAVDNDAAWGAVTPRLPKPCACRATCPRCAIRILTTAESNAVRRGEPHHVVLVFFELRLLTSQPPEIGTARWSQLRLGALGLRGPVSLNKSPPTRGDADRSRGAANFDVAGPRQRILNIHPLVFRGSDCGCDRPGVRTSAWFRTAQTVHQPQVRELLGSQFHHYTLLLPDPCASNSARSSGVLSLDAPEGKV